MWTFSQSSGQLRNTDGELVGVGYAGGNCGHNPEGINNPDMQNIPKIGPLPQGKYTKGVAIDHSTLGAFAIPLIPDPTNEMYCRSDFYFHGDTTTPECGSEGCIVASPSLRHEWYDGTDNVMQVIP